MRAPIPQRIAPLSWRKPAFLWTPAALFMAIAWPGVLFSSDPGLQRLAIIAGLVVFAVALITPGINWAVGRAPKERRVVVMHVVMAGALTAIAAPFLLTELLAVVANYQHQGAGDNFSLSMALAMAPLALLLGLPISLVSGLIFAWVALHRGRIDDADLATFESDVQPFR